MADATITPREYPVTKQPEAATDNKPQNEKHDSSSTSECHGSDIDSGSPVSPQRSTISDQNADLEKHAHGQHKKETNSQNEIANFEVEFEGNNDPMSPRNKTTLRKWLIVIQLAACSFNVTWFVLTLQTIHRLMHSLECC